ncbi:MAG TPA: DUF4272 domain-containing protein [Flavitalea sp.]|nr:DUF4272 domain-containing protein [Flavitalea sp.]
MDAASRIESVINRLKSHHVDEKFFPGISALENKADVLPAETIARRLLVLLAASFTAYNFDGVEKVTDWLKRENVWASASEKEKLFFRDPAPPETEKQQLSWRFEAAYILAWALQKVSGRPDASRELPETGVKEFLLSIPAIGTPVEEFLRKAKLRSLDEIIDEKLFYESAVRSLNDQQENDLENSTSIHPMATFERYFALCFITNGNTISWDELTRIEEEDEF